MSEKCIVFSLDPGATEDAWDFETQTSSEEGALEIVRDLAAEWGLTTIQDVNKYFKVGRFMPLREKKPDKRIELEFDEKDSEIT